GAPAAIRLRRAQRRGEAVHAPARRTVHDLDTATGSEPQAPLLGADDDAHRPAALRVGLHHLHAYGLDDALGVGTGGRARPGSGALRTGIRPGAAAPLRTPSQERAGGARGDPAR